MALGHPVTLSFNLSYGSTNLSLTGTWDPSLSLQTSWVCGPSKQWTVTVFRLTSYPDFLLSILHRGPCNPGPCHGL